ncbi:peptidase [Synechococcus phage DSL-LC03]|nr:peptidase [Synechococcus phage DSL-LC03]
MVGFFRIIGSVQKTAMTINFEIKGQLAKLLATEDLVVEHKKVSTACFNVQSRVLTLPLWERASNAVYDMLVAHEVGHALYTPNEDWTDRVKVPQSYVNIVEDVRIEKLMKRRYAGLAKTMYNGYKELNEQDFFDISEEDHNKYSLADRVNLHYKIGNFISVEFDDGEKTIVDMIGECETFADTLIAAEELYKYSKNQKKEEDLENNASVQIESGASGGATETVDIDPESSSEQSGESSMTQPTSEEPSDVEDKTPSQSSDLSGGKNMDDDVKTDQRLKDAIEQLVNSSPFNENVYLELPELDLKSVIAENKKIHEYIQNFWNESIQRKIDAGWKTKDAVYEHIKIDSEFAKFKVSAQKEVNYLVKEFECKKAADSYARATTARTGVLDCTKLHTYKYNEDLFKKVTTLADGKNHGLIFVLDWSGSMDRVLLDTVKQVCNLIWFCKKVSIPFEVYAFTNEWSCVTYDATGRPIYPTKHHKKEDGYIKVDADFSMMNFFTSKTSTKELENQMRSIFKIAYSYSNRNHYRDTVEVPSRIGLSGTPLNEALIALTQIIPQFQNDNKLQKVHSIVLTDGEGCGMTYYAACERHGTDSWIGVRGFNPSTCFIRDRKNGNLYATNKMYDYMTAQSDMLLRYIRNRYPHVSLIGMRVLSSGEAGSFIRKYFHGNQSAASATTDTWKKEKSFSIPTEGYHKYFGISSTALSTDVEFAVGDNATKTQIRSAFKKSLKSKQLNKKILNEFVQLIA